jgi:hypothetical protein
MNTISELEKRIESLEKRIMGENKTYSNDSIASRLQGLKYLDIERIIPGTMDQNSQNFEDDPDPDLETKRDLILHTEDEILANVQALQEIGDGIKYIDMPKMNIEEFVEFMNSPNYHESNLKCSMNLKDLLSLAGDLNDFYATVNQNLLSLKLQMEESQN